MLEPLGPLSAGAATAIFAQQVEALLDGGVDFILIETMSDLGEVQAAIRGARQVDEGVLIAATLTFDRNGRTMMGVRPLQALAALHGQGISIIGANCGNGPQEIEAVMEQMAEHRPEGVFLMAQSNAGLPHEVDGRMAYDGTPEVMAAYARRMQALGVNVIGACCGSTPAHIAAMHTALFG
jgi:5-methyltetrahydrofolate--homocysteine methyltransferase